MNDLEPSKSLEEVWPFDGGHWTKIPVACSTETFILPGPNGASFKLNGWCIIGKICYLSFSTFLNALVLEYVLFEIISLPNVQKASGSVWDHIEEFMSVDDVISLLTSIDYTAAMITCYLVNWAFPKMIARNFTTVQYPQYAKCQMWSWGSMNTFWTL